MKIVFACTLFAGVSLSSRTFAQDALFARFVDSQLDSHEPVDSLFAGAPERTIVLMAQPMMPPRPATTTTETVKVRAIHDGKWLSLRIQWADPERSEGGRTGEYSDAVAVQFPKSNVGDPPPVFMGFKGQAVHIVHWRAQYQVDRDLGQKDVKDIYANTGVDHHPFDYKSYEGGSLSPETQTAYGSKEPEPRGFWASLFGLSDAAEATAGDKSGFSEDLKEQYLPGRAAGNPQSYAKTQGVDDIVAEGFGTSQVLPEPKVRASGAWADGKWTVTIARPLDYPGRSKLEMGKPGHLAFAVWQGGQKEVGSRKSVTMSWTSIEILTPDQTKERTNHE